MNERRKRLSIPKELSEHLPYTYWALSHFRKRSTIEWVSIKKEVKKAQPYFRTFNEETRQLISELADRHGVTDSRLLTTALSYYATEPKLPRPRRGLAVDENG